MSVSRLPWAPTTKDRVMVHTMASYGIPLPEIAAVFDITAQTLCKWCRRELETAAPIINTKVVQFLASRAMGLGPDERANIMAASLWVRTRMGWNEKTIHEVYTMPPNHEQTQTEFDLGQIHEKQFPAIWQHMAHNGTSTYQAAVALGLIDQDHIRPDDDTNIVPFKQRQRRLSDPRPL